MTESATQKRGYSKQSEMSPPWRCSPFAPVTDFGLATGSEMVTPPFQKRLRTEKKTVSTFKWEPDVPGNTQFSAGYGFRDMKVRTPLAAALQELPSYYQKYVDAKRELEDFKRVARALNSWVPLSSNGTCPAFSSLEKMRRRGSNLQQGPMNLYDIQDVQAKKSQRGGGQSNLGTPNGEPLTRTSQEDARPNEELHATGSGSENFDKR